MTPNHRRHRNRLSALLAFHDQRRPCCGPFGNARRISAMKMPILGSLGVIAVTAALNLASAQSDGHPVLLFRGYGSDETNKAKVAKFELRNTTTKTIRLDYEGSKPPLTAPILVRAVTPVKPSDTNWSVRASFRHWFTEEHVLLPGKTLRLEFPLVPGDAAVQVGLEYYLNRLEDHAEKPERREVWCPQAVCHQASTSDSSAAHREGSPGRKRE